MKTLIVVTTFVILATPAFADGFGYQDGSPSQDYNGYNYQEPPPSYEPPSYNPCYPYACANED